MPELPEVEITARRLDAALRGAEVESALAPGMVALKTFDPPLEALAGRRIAGVRRVGKMPVVEFAGPDDDPHRAARPPDVGRAAPGLRQAGLAARPRLAGAGPARRRPRAAPARVRHQAARLGEAAARRRRSRDDEMVATLGPEAWPAPPLEELARRIDQPRHLHPLLRDQRDDRRDRPLLGRRDPLGGARSRRSSKGSELDDEEVERLHAALHVLGDAIDHYEEVIGDDGARQDADAAPGPPPRGRALPALRRRRSRRSSSPSTRPTTAPRSRPAAGCSRTAGSRGSSSRAGTLAILKLRCRDSYRGKQQVTGRNSPCD